MDRKSRRAAARREKAADVPRKGNVDRKDAIRGYSTYILDVPRKGNVDRKTYVNTVEILKDDVPRKGNVDRKLL